MNEHWIGMKIESLLNPVIEGFCYFKAFGNIKRWTLNRNYHYAVACYCLLSTERLITTSISTAVCSDEIVSFKGLALPSTLGMDIKCSVNKLVIYSFYTTHS